MKTKMLLDTRTSFSCLSGIVVGF